MTVEHKRIISLRDEINTKELDDETIRIYLIQIEQLLPKPTKTLYIDADSIIYYIAYSPTNSDMCEPEEGSFIGDKIDIDLKESYYSLVHDIVASCRKESLMGNMIRFKDFKLVYTPSTNFRYDIFPDYKKSRIDKKESDELIYLKSQVKKEGIIIDGVEADDVVAYYSRRGHPIASGDKDVIYGVEGNHYYYHAKHRTVIKTSKDEASKFVLLQTLAGDSTDDIPGISGIGMKTKLLDKIDNPTFDDVIKIYESKSLTKEDAILTRRLVGLDQWKGKRRGVKLWNY